METHTVLDIGETIGDCGKFQMVITATVHSASMLAAWGMMFMAFGIHHPGWTCSDNEARQQTRPFSNLGGSIENTSLAPNNPSMTGSALNNNPSSVWWTLDCDLKEECQNLTYNHDSSTVASEWNISCGSSWISSVIISIQMTGVLVGSCVGGQIGDAWGRKVCLYGHIALHGISHLAAIASVSWQTYTAIMFFIGYSVGGILAFSFPYPLEFVPEWWRGVLAALPLWNVGSTTFALTVYVFRDWKQVHLVTGVVSAVVFLPVFWTPESVRWLAVKGQVEKAKRLVAKIAGMNGKPCPDTRTIDNLAEEEKREMGSYKYTYLDLFRIRTLRGLTLKFGTIWVIMAVCFYAISFGISSLSGDFYVNFLMSTALEFPGMLLVAPLMNILGRRKAALIFFSMAVVGAFSVVIVSFAASGSLKDLTIFVLAITSKALILAAWAVFTVYSSELYPTVVRSLHYGYLGAVSRLGAIISPYLLPADPNLIYLPFLIIGVLCSGNCLLTWSLPESKGKVLQDRSQDAKRNWK